MSLAEELMRKPVFGMRGRIVRPMGDEDIPVQPKPPVEYDQAMIARMRGLMATGHFNAAQLARITGIPQTTLVHWRRRHRRKFVRPDVETAAKVLSLIRDGS